MLMLNFLSRPHFAKSRFSLFIVLLFAAFSARAQNQVALQHGTTTTFHATIAAALTAAVNHDVIILPGGVFPGFTVDKKLTIIGAGYNPDSTAATLPTTISGNITFTTNANDSTLVTGLYVTNSILLNAGTNAIQIERCRFDYVHGFGNGTSGNAYPSNMLIRECVIGNGSADNFVGVIKTSLISNCILLNQYLTGSSVSYESEFKNCLFFGSIVFGGYCCPYAVPTGMTFTNCISKPNVGNTYAYCTFNGNINFGVNGTNGTNTGSGNFFNNEAFSTLFVSETNNTYNYSDDLHLTNAAYNTGGSNGAPIGLYGGIFVWKDGGLPFNPHISTATIGNQTNANGNLPVNITVRAQGN